MLMIKKKEMESSNGQMVENMLGNGKMANNMDKAHLQQQMAK